MVRCLANIAAGSHSDSWRVAMMMPKIITLLADDDITVKEQAIWVIGNVAGDCDECRLCTVSALPYVTNILATVPADSKTNSNSIRTVCAWAICNIMRGKTPALAFLSTGKVFTLIYPCNYSSHRYC
jgi:hypothetical protein